MLQHSEICFVCFTACTWCRICKHPNTEYPATGKREPSFYSRSHSVREFPMHNTKPFQLYSIQRQTTVVKVKKTNKDSTHTMAFATLPVHDTNAIPRSQNSKRSVIT